MKVALYAGIFKRNQDGATRSLYELVDSLIKNHIVTGVWGFSITPQNRNGLFLFEVPSVPLIGYPEYRLTLNNLRLDLELRKFKPDIIHVTVPDLVGLQFSRFARQHNIPLVYTFHTDFPSYLRYFKMGSLYHISWQILKGYYNQGDVVFAPTQEYINKLESNGIQNVKLWSRGIHPDQFNPAFRSEQLRESWGVNNKKVILFAGRLVWFKNLEAVIHVYRKLKQKMPGRVQFVLAGQGPAGEEVKKKMPDAIFTGHVTGKTLSAIYASSDVFLFPSTTEAFGNVVLEALASGLPAIVSSKGGCQEIIAKSHAGCVIDASDPENFFHATISLLQDDDNYIKLRNLGLAYAANQSWDQINMQIINTYRDLHENGPQPKYKESLFQPIIDLINQNP